MPVVLASSHASPQNRFPQERIGETVAMLYGGAFPDLDGGRIRKIFGHSRIRERAFLMPLEWYASPHGGRDRAEVFARKGLELMVEASSRCLAEAGFGPERIDTVIFVTTTGISAPSLDSHLVNALGMRRNTVRIPLWGLGCAGGAAGLARASDFCLAAPRSAVLLVSLETCSLNFSKDDTTPLNLVAMSLFSDCCAAVLVCGDEAPEAAAAAGPRILASASHLFPATTGLIGWAVADDGLRLVLTPELPGLLRSELAGLADSFLAGNGLSRGDIVHYMAHPGGARIMDALLESLGLANGELRLSEEVLRDFGNVSSASVLLVLERWMKGDGPAVPGYGLLVSFGPGLAAEFVLVRA